MVNQHIQGKLWIGFFFWFRLAWIFWVNQITHACLGKMVY